MNPLPFIPAFLILPVLFSCTQKSNLEIATGKVTTIKLGNVVRIKEINVLTSTDDGTFANMAGTAAAWGPQNWLPPQAPSWTAGWKQSK